MDGEAKRCVGSCDPPHLDREADYAAGEVTTHSAGEVQVALGRWSSPRAQQLPLPEQGRDRRKGLAVGAKASEVPIGAGGTRATTKAGGAPTTENTQRMPPPPPPPRRISTLGRSADPPRRLPLRRRPRAVRGKAARRRRRPGRALPRRRMARATPRCAQIFARPGPGEPVAMEVEITRTGQTGASASPPTPQSDTTRGHPPRQADRRHSRASEGEEQTFSGGGSRSASTRLRPVALRRWRPAH